MKISFTILLLITFNFQIMAQKQSTFQRKSYLLAKIIFTLETHGLVDTVMERKLCSYHLKTVYLFILENTPQKQFRKLEQAKDYLKLAFLMFERLSKALKDGYLPCFFVQQMNLLQGFDQNFLNDVGYRFKKVIQRKDFIEKLVDEFKQAPILSLLSIEEGQELSSMSL